jgi:predicted MPP superfamily phosphohydrolase
MPTYLRFVVFFVVLATALGGINWFVYKRTTRAFDMSQRWRRWFGGVLVFGLVAMFASRTVGRFFPGTLAGALGLVGAAIQLGAIVTFAVMALQLASAWLVRCAAWIWRKLRPAAEAELQTNLERRTFIAKAAAGAAVGLGGGSAVYGAAFGRHDYVIEEVPVPLANLPPALDGYTIVQLSDVHLGLFVGAREIDAMIELVSRANPDLVVLTGDLLDHDPRYADLLGSMTRRLRHLAPVAAIAGNHDYYAGIDNTLSTLRRAGADVLVNEARLIGDGGGEVALVGVDDMWARRFGPTRGPNIERAIARLPDREVPRILLCHNPAYFPKAAPHVDLQLSGHTHGGQFNPGVRPADLLLPYGYVAGRYHRDNAQLWVNRGFGTAGPPARIGAPPEVTKIVLTTS